VIKNVKRFQLIIKHTSCGMLFRQIAAAIGHTRDVMSIGKLSGVSDHLVGQYVRVLVDVALTKIDVLLSSDDVWAFSIAFMVAPIAASRFSMSASASLSKGSSTTFI
jgi:hypothetical protein